MRRAVVLLLAVVALAGCGSSGSGSQSRSKPVNEANLMRQEHRPTPIKMDKEQDPNPYSARPTG